MIIIAIIVRYDYSYLFDYCHYMIILIIIIIIISLLLLIIIVIVNTDVTDAIYLIFSYCHYRNAKQKKNISKYIKSVSECLPSEDENKIKIEDLLVKLIYIMYIICYCCSILWWSFQLRYDEGDTIMVIQDYVTKNPLVLF